MDAQQERLELQATVAGDHDLAVEDKARLGAANASKRLAELREISVQGLQVPRLQVDLRAITKDEGPKTVPLRLVAPPVADGQLRSGLGQHRLNRRRNREGQRVR